jgi:hypothetical protein
MTSQINPANIDSNYPVANQNNNSQGFRDNFTNIKVNFQDAAAEITDIQNKGIFKAALTGQTLDNDMADAALIAAQIRDFSATKVTVGSTSGAIPINYSQGHYQAITTTGSITLSFNNFPGSGLYGYIKLQINITNVAHTVTLPAAVTLGTSGIQGLVGSTITFSGTGTFEFAFGTYDAGATITIFDLNRALTNFSGGNVSVANLTATTATVTSTITANIINGSGTFSTTGNVVGNVVSGALISTTGNVSGGNVISTGLVSAIGNVSGGNITGFVRPSSGTASQSPIQLTAGTNTSIAAAGAFEYDGVVFYQTAVASQRALQAGAFFVALVNNYSANDNTAAQKIFNQPSAGAITVNSNTTYLMEGLYIVAPAVNFNAIAMQTLFALSGGAALNSIRYVADSSVGLATAVTSTTSRQVNVATTTTVTSASPGGAATNFVVRITGIVRVSTGGTFTPQMAFTGTPGSAPTVQAGSYLRMTPLGTASVTTTGPWT